jgi:hypothetical protein
VKRERNDQKVECFEILMTIIGAWPMRETLAMDGSSAKLWVSDRSVQPTTGVPVLGCTKSAR